MYKGLSVLCIIPARGGSKGLPGKNLKKLCGKPLIAHTIAHALASRYIDRTIVSTESRKIADTARRSGAEVPFMRPARLARDNSGTIDVLEHVVEKLARTYRKFYDIVVLLHATTPLRSAEDVDKSIELLAESGADNVFSVAQAHRNPYFNMVEIRGGKARLVCSGNYAARQLAPKVYDMNSSIYIWRRESLMNGGSCFLGKTLVYEMPKERSIDIDDNIDFMTAEMLMKKTKTRSCAAKSVNPTKRPDRCQQE